MTVTRVDSAEAARLNGVVSITVEVNSNRIEGVYRKTDVMRRTLWYSLAVVPLILIPLRVCRAVARPIGHPLAPEVPAADAETAWTLVRFGTPAAEPFEEQGLDIPLDRRGETWAAARRRVEIRLRFPEAAPRVAVLDLASFPGVGTQAATVLLNGRRIGAVDVTPERRRVRVTLPVERQQPGENRLGLRFAEAAAPSPPSGHRYAARLYGLVVAPPSPEIDALLDPAAPPFSFWAEDRALVQAGPSRLHWANRWPAGTLRVGAALHRWSRERGGRARLRVTLAEAGGVRDLWQAELGPPAAAAPEAWIELPAGAPGEAQRLTLSVEPLGPAPVWVSWRDLEVVPAYVASPFPAAGALRDRLRGLNVVLVVFDAAGARHFGCYGQEQATTPEADRLAAEGVVFERAYTPAVFTLSAMASLWTSRLPDEHHRSVAHDAALPDGLPTLAEVLGAHGVGATGLVGNGMAGRGFGLDRGFGEFSYVGYHSGDVRGALDRWIAGDRRQPSFLYVHYRQPHTPLDPPPPLDRQFGSAVPLSPEALDEWMDAVNHRRLAPTAAGLARYQQLYHGNLAVADRELGWLRRRLEEAGLWERTVLVLTADHGEALHEHGFIGHNEQLYEESVHVPLVVRFPAGRGPRGVRVATPVDLLDVAPTVAEVFGIRGPAVASFRGRSLLEVALEGQGRGEVLARTAGPRPVYALMDGTTKYLFNSRYGLEELYDLRSDPGEQRDVAAAQPLRASVYRQRMHRLLLELPGRWTGEPAQRRVGQERLEDLRALGYVN